MNMNIFSHKKNQRFFVFLFTLYMRNVILHNTIEKKTKELGKIIKNQQNNSTFKSKNT